MKPLSNEAQQIISAARSGELPTAADRKRLGEQLNASLAVGRPGPDIEAPKWVIAARKAWVVKGLLVVTASAGLGGGLYFARTSSSTPERNLTVAPIAPPTDDRVLVEPVEPAPPVAPSTPVEPTRAATAKPAPVAPVRPAIVAKVPEALEPPKPAPQVEPEEVTPPAPTLREDDSLEAEARALLEVHAALRANEPARALELVRAQQRLFTHGQLGPEREAAEVLARCAIDRVDGRAAFDTFRERHPQSPLLNRLSSACGR